MLTAAMDDISETEFGQYQNVNLDWTFYVVLFILWKCAVLLRTEAPVPARHQREPNPPLDPPLDDLNASGESQRDLPMELYCV